MLSLGTVFWIIIIILVLFFGALYGGLLHPSYGIGLNNLVELVLFCLLGWATFGPPIRGSRN